MLLLSNANVNDDDNRFWVKDMRRRTRTTVILTSKAAPPPAACSQKSKVRALTPLSKEVFFQENNSAPLKI